MASVAERKMREWAEKFSTFDDFSREYSVRGVRPVMWHLTESPDFRVRTDVVPSDVPGGSGTRSTEPGRGGLMVAATPSSWSRDMLPGDRDYVAAIDITALDPGKDYTVTGRGYDEVYIHNPGKVKVLKVYGRKSGISAANRMWKQYPRSRAEMEDIWNEVHGRTGVALDEATGHAVARDLLRMARSLIAISDEEAIRRMGPGARRRQKHKDERYEEWKKKKVPVWESEWTKVEGNEVLQVPGSKYVAVPVSGRKNSREFYIVDLTDRRDMVTQLRKKEVTSWLARMAEEEGLKPTGYMRMKNAKQKM